MPQPTYDATQSECLHPTYNYARFLPEAIESILNQNFTDFELLIIDDCSSDNTAEVVCAYAAKDRRISFSVNSPNIGMVNNWNLCLRRARGEYIKFVFGDDVLISKDALLKMMERSCATSRSASWLRRERLSTSNPTFPGPVEFLEADAHRGRRSHPALRVRQKNLIGEPTVVMFRKKTAPADSTRATPDRGFGNVVSPAGKRPVDFISPNPCARFRCHPDQQSEHNSKSNATLDDMALIFDDYLARPYLHFGLAGSPDHCLRLLLFRLETLSEKHDEQRGGREPDQSLGEISEIHLLLPLYKLVRPFLNLSGILPARLATTKCPHENCRANVHEDLDKIFHRKKWKYAEWFDQLKTFPGRSRAN